MTSTPRTGERLGEYALIERIAATPGCETYFARHVAGGHEVEIAALTPAGVGQAGVVEHLVRSANLARGLEDPALARVIALDADAHGVPFVVEEHVRGQSMARLLERSPKGLPLDFVLRALTPVAAALARCHEAGLVHGAIDREHIVLADTQAFSTRLIRFGRRGDAARSAPESRTGVPTPTTRGDVWALAALMHEMLWGSPPLVDPTTVRLPLHGAGIPAELAALLRQCLAYTPAARPEDAAALRDVMLSLGQATQPGASPKAVPTQTIMEFAATRRNRRRRRVMMVDPVTGLAVERSPSRRFRATVVGHTPDDASDSLRAAADACDESEAPAPQPVGAAQPMDAPSPGPALGAAATQTPVATAEHPAVLPLHVAAFSAANAATSPARVELADRPPSQPAIAEQATAAAALAGDTPAGPAYHLPAKTFWDLRPKPGAGAPVPEAEPSAPTPAAPVLRTAVTDATSPRPATSLDQVAGLQRNGDPSPDVGQRSIQPRAGRAGAARSARKSIRARMRAPSGNVRDKGKRRSIAAGRAPSAAPVARSHRKSMAALQALRTARAVKHASSDRIQAVQPAPALPAQPQLRPPGEARARFGADHASAAQAIQRAGEREAQRGLASELLTLVFCALMFVGIPLVCDPARAADLLGTHVRLGFALIAASAAIASVQLWWRQSSSRDALLWPASTAIKALTLMIFLLVAARFVPEGMFGSLETSTRALLPWTAGAFFLALGAHGVLRARYNTEQHATLGLILTLLYGGSALGSIHVFNTSMGAHHQATSRDQLAASLQQYARNRNANSQLGSLDVRTLESELEAQGDTTGSAGGFSTRTGTGDAETDDLHSSGQLRNTRTQQAAQLEALHKQLESLNKSAPKR